MRGERERGEGEGRRRQRREKGSSDDFPLVFVSLEKGDSTNRDFCLYVCV